MEYKSNRSERFRIWLSNMDDRKLEDLVLLEKAARILVHRHDLVGDVDNADVHMLARIAKKIQSQYEE